MRAALVLIGLACAVPLVAGRQPPRPLAIEQFKDTGATIKVQSRAFEANAVIPSRYSDYGEKISPDLSWSGAPATAKSFVVMVEDPDAKDPKPFVHWLLYNLPPTITTLPESIPATPRLPEFGGALQGRNSRGTIGYFGPRPPKGDPPHHYHFQVLALDTVLTVDPAADARTLLAAMAGHVVARGEAVGLYQALDIEHAQ